MLQAIHQRISLRDMPIRRKLLAVTLTVALLVNLGSLGGFQLVTSQSNHMIYSQTAGSLAAVSDKISSRLNNLTEISLYIAVNREFQTSLLTLNEELTSARYLARSSISEVLYRTFHSDIVTITVFPNNSTPIILGYESSQEDQAVYSRAQDLAAGAKGAPVWLPTGRGDGSVLLVREIRSVNEPFLEPMGLLMLRVNLDKIVKDSTADLLSGAHSITISQNGEHLYPHLTEGHIPLDSSVFSGDTPYAISRRDGQMSFVTRSHIKAFRLNWDFLLSIPYDDVFRSLVAANILFILCLALAVIAAVLLSRRMLGGINRDIALLTAKMNQVRKGDLEPYRNPETLGRDELGTLNLHFDKMTADFKQVIEDNYVKQLLLTQTQLKALEQQINPHFLYNSLESINWFARSGDGKNVSAIAQALGALLRSALSQDEDRISLRQELTILESYLSIQRIRFPDTLRVQTQADEVALDALVPKMSIQPLVENAIIHSLEENIGECHISVRVSLQGDMVLVEVENDGSEIDVDIMDKLRDRKVQPKGHGIGLINIDSRLKILFGNEYGLQLKNLQDRVVVSFSIPACFKGEITC